MPKHERALVKLSLAVHVADAAARSAKDPLMKKEEEATVEEIYESMRVLQEDAKKG